MKRTSITFINTLLAVGMMLVFIGFLLIAAFLLEKAIIRTVYPLLAVFAGFVFFYFYLAFSPSAVRLFFGFSLTLSGFFFFLVLEGMVPFSVKEWWPVAMALTGISLFLTGRIKSRRMVMKFVFPAGMLCTLGALFLLFSFGVVTVPFSRFALILAPLLLIASGIFLIVLFFQRKSLLELLPDGVSEEFEGRVRTADAADEDEIGEEL